MVDSRKKVQRYMVEPSDDGQTLSALIRRFANEGAGRPLNGAGHIDGPWTAQTIFEEVNKENDLKETVSLRAVQYWFLDEDRGISQANINRLAKIFGCYDPDLASAYRLVMAAAKRRQKTTNTTKPIMEVADDPNPAPVADTRTETDHTRIARATHYILQGRSPLNVPIIVFIYATSMCMVSLTLNVHSIDATIQNDVTKQVGYLWAPNWTLTFLLSMPLYLAFVAILLNYWENSRAKLDSAAKSWAAVTNTYSLICALIFFATVILASLYNWYTSYFLPVYQGDLKAFAVDWGRISIINPELISARSSIVFSGLAFALNAFCSYFFFTGLLFIHIITSDFETLVSDDNNELTNSPKSIRRTCNALQRLIFCACALGMTITIYMKLQARFLASNDKNILRWLANDFVSLINNAPVSAGTELFVTGDFYSFFCTVPIVGTHFYNSIRLRKIYRQNQSSTSKYNYFKNYAGMDAMIILVTAITIFGGHFRGFSVLIMLAILLLPLAILKSYHTYNIKDA